MAKRQPFTKEFKLEAVRLWKSSGRPAAAVARELGLRRNHLQVAVRVGDTRRGRVSRQGREKKRGQAELPPPHSSALILIPILSNPSFSARSFSLATCGQEDITLKRDNNVLTMLCNMELP